MTIAQLLVRITGDGSGLAKTVAVAKASLGGLRSFGSKIVGAFGKLGGVGGGLLSLAGIGALAKGALEFADNTKTMADRLNVSTDMIQRLDFLANQTGTSVDTLAMMMKKLAINQAKALQGSKPLLEMFNAIGISSSKLAMEPEQFFSVFIDAASRVKGLNNQLMVLQTLAGKSADQALPAIREGAGKIMAGAPVVDARAIKDFEMLNDMLGEGMATLKKKGIELMWRPLADPGIRKAMGFPELPKAGATTPSDQVKEQEKSNIILRGIAASIEAINRKTPEDE